MRTRVRFTDEYRAAPFEEAAVMSDGSIGAIPVFPPRYAKTEDWPDHPVKMLVEEEVPEKVET